MTSRWAATAALSVVGLCISVWLGWTFTGGVALSGKNDFLSIYAGARVAGTKDLYNPARHQEIQEKDCGFAGDVEAYSRLPYYAWMLRPLGRLPYRTAYGVWEALSIAASLGFLLFWGPVNQPVKWAAFAWSMPLFLGLCNGQDIGFVLLWASLSVFLAARKKPFAGGLALCLAASKFHFLLLVPVVILARRAWRFGAGFVVGGAVLLALSFLSGGADWPVRYLALIASDRMQPSLSQMPTWHALLAGIPGSPGLEIAATLLTALAVLVISRRRSWNYSLAAALAGGVLIGFHAYVADCALWLPAIVMIFAESKSPGLRLMATVLALPAVCFFLLGPPPLPQLSRLALVAALGWMAIEAWQGRKSTLPYGKAVNGLAEVS